MFEEFIHSARPGSHHRHERMSVQMLESLLQEVRARRRNDAIRMQSVHRRRIAVHQ
jgi:hypothetical protein